MQHALRLLFSGKLLGVDGIAVGARTWTSLNALAPQMNAVCLCSTPRPRQRRFRRLYGHRPAFWPQGQFPPHDTAISRLETSEFR
jgi:hypothetical protein